MGDQVPSSPERQPKKGYGKRPVWQWVVLYLVIAAVVYGLIYYFFFHGTGGGGGYSY